MATHAFGMMSDAPLLGERYDEHEPQKYACIFVDDDYIENIAAKLSLFDFYWHTLSAKGKGLAYYGITLIPPSLHNTFIKVIEREVDLSELKKLFEKAREEKKWVIHYGI